MRIWLLFVTISFFCCGSAHAHPFKEKQVFSDITPFYKWVDVLNRMETEPENIDNFSRIREKYLTSSTIRKVNDFVNSYSFIDDTARWGASDYWQTPGEFFSSGGGDCEDYAITKYAWLKTLGVNEDNMRIAVVHDRFLKTMHTLLFVDINGKSMVLDNQEKKPESHIMEVRYEPLFSFNRNSWWLY